MVISAAARTRYNWEAELAVVTGEPDDDPYAAGCIAYVSVCSLYE